MIKSIINELEIDSIENSIKMLRELDRDDYLELKTILERFGASYKTNKKCFIFKTDPKPLIDTYLKTGILPEKNPTAFFPTPKNLVDTMMRVSSFEYFKDYDESYQSTIRVLEPSAGVAGIADVIKEIAPFVTLDTVEILPTNQSVLKAKGYNPYCMDFLEFNKDTSITYDYILMNPPFQGTTYIKHIKHALSMLKANGTLSAIVPGGFLTGKTKLDEELLNEIAMYGNIYKNPKKSFSDSGTDVETYIITLEKSDWKLKPYQGHTNYYNWYLFVLLTNEDSFYTSIIKFEPTTKFDLQEFIKELIFKYIEIFKTDEIFVPKQFIDQYVKLMFNYALDCYENAGIEFDFLIEIENNTVQNEYQVKDICIYTQEQLATFAKGSLF